jgi:hypothetical protein
MHPCAPTILDTSSPYSKGWHRVPRRSRCPLRNAATQWLPGGAIACSPKKCAHNVRSYPGTFKHAHWLRLHE